MLVDKAKKLAAAVKVHLVQRQSQQLPQEAHQTQTWTPDVAHALYPQYYQYLQRTLPENGHPRPQYMSWDQGLAPPHAPTLPLLHQEAQLQEVQSHHRKHHSHYLAA